MPTPRFLKTKPLCGSLSASLILSLSLLPFSAHAMDFEEATVTKAEALQSQSVMPVRNAAAAVNNTANKATRQTADVYDKVLEYQKSKRPLGNQLKATFSPKKIPGITKAERTAAAMSIPAILLIFTFIISFWGLGKSGAYERN